MTTIFKNKNFIPALLFFFIPLLLINSVITFYNERIIIENNALKVETEIVKRITASIIKDIIHGADLSVRGFAITKNEQLADPLKIVLSGKDSIFITLEALLIKQHYNMTEFREMKAEVENYLSFSIDMLQLARQDSMKQFVQLLDEDRGYDVWKKYESFYVPLFAFEDNLNAKAEEKYIQALTGNRVIQIILTLLFIPTIIYIIRKLKAERDHRVGFLTALDQSNRRYIFDTGTSLNSSNQTEAIADSILNFQRANEFVTKISANDYTAEWDGLNESNQQLNQTNLAGNLIRMREFLRQTKSEDERRSWTVSGLAKFAEIIRDQTDFQKLGDAIISNIVKYTNSNQGGLFVVNDEDRNDIHLRLLSCYAWDKKKHIGKTIHAGEGQAGQCWQEGNSIFMTKVPVDYVNITSGLGHATPRCVFLAPLKVNDAVYGVLELASFQTYQKHELEFIEKVCETIASAIATVKVAEQTKQLLEQSQQQAEELRSQEEEMRQNMEELQSIQAEMQRKTSEVENRIKAIDNSGIASIEFDLNGNIITANESFLTMMQYSLNEIEGKHHRLFMDSVHANSEDYKKLWQDLKAGITKPGEYECIRKDRSKIYISGSYSVMCDGSGKPSRVLKLATDITDSKRQLILLREQEEKMRQDMEELQVTLQDGARKTKDLERSNSQAEAQKQMMLKVIEKLKEKEKENQAQAEELHAQQEELRQNIEELHATQDQTQKMFAEVQSKEQYLFQLMDASTDSILTFDKEYAVVHYNKVAKANFAKAGCNLEGESINLLAITSERNSQIKNVYDKALAGETIQNETESHGHHFITQYIPLRNEDDEVIAVAMFSKDVTQVAKAKVEA